MSGEKKIEIVSIGYIDYAPGRGFSCVSYKWGLIEDQVFLKKKPDRINREELERHLNAPNEFSHARFRASLTGCGGIHI